MICFFLSCWRNPALPRPFSHVNQTALMSCSQNPPRTIAALNVKSSFLLCLLLWPGCPHASLLTPCLLLFIPQTRRAHSHLSGFGIFCFLFQKNMAGFFLSVRSQFRDHFRETFFDPSISCSSPSLSRLSLPFCILYNTVAMWKHHVCLFVCVVCSLSPPCVCKCLWSRALCHLLPSVPSIVEQWLTHSKH